MKKRITILAMAAVIVLLLSACGNGGKTMQRITSDKRSDDQSMSSYMPGTTGEQSSSPGVYEYETRDIWLTSRGNKIYGKAYLPVTENKCPLVIFAHELGVTHTTGEGYAEYFASRGIAYYVFDFPGGSISGSKSDGKTTEMSIMTEAEDLKAVVEAAQYWTFVDPERIWLHGGSQGGMVAAMTATMLPEKIAGLYLLILRLSFRISCIRTSLLWRMFRKLSLTLDGSRWERFMRKMHGIMMFTMKSAHIRDLF
jgi:predicted peptidase